MDTPQPSPAPYTPGVTPAPAPVQMPPPAGSHAGMLLGILAAVVVLAAAAYYFLVMKGDDVAVVSPSPSASASPQVSPGSTPNPSTSTTPPAVGGKTYTNEQYGFEVSLPASWASYVASTAIPAGMTAVVQIAYSATAQLPAQAFEILVYTPAQWDAELRLDQPHPQKIIQSGTYVFATPFRFETSGLPGEADIPGILASFKSTR